ncbi:FAD-binding dehydrogenase [Amnibacterium sp. CER49]|uniref:FAD-binding dehydrogenase n=1 Tax=Amnibacterium sp. CER49 TaxID=3039161 RepID=UPI002447C1F6|nr:FAD-binding dehydrogenase [Amnibacterium sp. CER49]MDH2444160.1 FAD-binding dehydrogenase [Amnibacterium sp. CER49]
MDADVLVVGGGLAGLVAADELLRAGRRVTIVEQESAANLGGQAWWSFGGIFLVDTPQQRRFGIRDSFDLAWQDWRGSAAWDRLEGEHPEDLHAQRWGRAFVEFAAGDARPWLEARGVRFTPIVGWAERGSGSAGGHGNSVPRFHVPWGTGTGVSEPFADRIRAAASDGRLALRFRHRVDGLVREGGAVTGVHGTVLAPDDAPRGAPTNRTVLDEFALTARAVVIATGGIGADHDQVRRLWPTRLGTPPARMLTGVPASVDGRMLDIAERAGVRLVNRDRMWHYTEGIENHSPVWPGHGIRILPGPSSLWFDALGRRLPFPATPGHDTLGTLRVLRTTPELQPYDHSWFVTTQRVLEKEFALSGSEQNPDLTGGSRREVLRTRLGRGAPPALETFLRRGSDFVVAWTLHELVAGMNALVGEPLLDAAAIERQMRERDAELANPYTKDLQVMSIRNGRRALSDRLLRVAKPHRVLDPAAGPLVAVRLRVITRKTLGGIQTDLDGRALDADGRPVPGLFAAGEAAGFGGGGAHGYNALEGTFLGGCLFTGRVVGRALARDL